MIAKHRRSAVPIWFWGYPRRPFPYAWEGFRCLDEIGSANILIQSGFPSSRKNICPIQVVSCACASCEKKSFGGIDHIFHLRFLRGKRIVGIKFVERRYAFVSWERIFAYKNLEVEVLDIVASRLTRPARLHEPHYVFVVIGPAPGSNTPGPHPMPPCGVATPFGPRERAVPIIIRWGRARK